MEIFNKVVEVSERIQNNRTLSDIAIKLGEEVGEVMGEVSIITGLSDYKRQDPLALIDELVDTYINIIDLGRKHYGNSFNATMFDYRLSIKLRKWEEKYQKQSE